jgi:hypothetical protein
MISLLVLTSSLCAGAASAAGGSVTLTQDPLVMRLGSNEFRIAFGINGEQFAA